MPSARTVRAGVVVPAVVVPAVVMPAVVTAVVVTAVVVMGVVVMGVVVVAVVALVVVAGAHRVRSLLIAVKAEALVRWCGGMPSEACSAFSTASRTKLAMWSFSTR